MFGILTCITNMVGGWWGCVTKCKKVTVQQKLCIKNSKSGGDPSDR